MHEWLPTGHMMSHMTKTANCPGCRCVDETFRHMLKCPNPLMRKKSDEVLKTAEDKVKRLQLPIHVRQCLMDILESQLKANDTPHVPVGLALKRAFESRLAEISMSCYSRILGIVVLLVAELLWR